MSDPVCATCNDTHQMTLHSDTGDSRQVMCTRCPTPCQKCRSGGFGAFCETTPCPCACHKPASRKPGAFVPTRDPVTGERIYARVENPDNVVPLHRCKCGYLGIPRSLELDGEHVCTLMICGVCIQETIAELDRVRPVFNAMLECGVSREHANLTITYLLELPKEER